MLDNSLMAARPGSVGETTPRILKKGDPTPEAFNPGNPAKQPATQKTELSSTGDPGSEQHEPISAAYEVGDPEKKPPKPQRSRSVSGTPKQNKPRVHIQEQQLNPPTPDVSPIAEPLKETPTTDFIKGENRSTSEPVAGSPGTKTFQ